MEKPIEIRWHGRAGQGVVTAGELLAETAMKEGKYFQAFPDYGPERMGAPVKSYTRISEHPIEIHSQILEPDVVIVVNPNLIGIVDLVEGLRDEGQVLVNTSESPAQIRHRLHLTDSPVKVWTVDAGRIGMETIGRDIPSTIMLGMVARATDLIQLDSLIQCVEEKLGEKLQRHIVEANLNGLKQAYEQAVEG
ncbi:MAG: 2-oxoacid:acceptor oxidoreductase family protein [Chloroflexia bacterium]|nr:2-oxoacid:acceptor oxidoreductase family protein [Chloroflexia bacterium]